MKTDYQQVIHRSRYARYLDDEQRRETWEETVERYCDNVVSPRVNPLTLKKLRNAILNQDICPSMRMLMTSGDALERDNVSGYNCAYLPLDHPRSFDEMMYILMCGTGVGFSVERQYTTKLPEVPDVFDEGPRIIVADSKIGWASSLRKLLSALWDGEIPTWDVSGVREAGARLRTFGGRASGPGPLEDLFSFCINTFKNAKGRKLSSLECHDIACKIGEAVVVGGVRRSALLSLSNLSDDRMRNAKSGQWWDANQQRSLANNSVCYTEKPTFDSFLTEWQSLYASKSGERGIYNRVAAENRAAFNGRRDSGYAFGTNPCSEIILRPYQFCNLTEVVVREDDTLESLRVKVTLATILGTIQSTYTDFRYLRSIWKKNTEEERLLGVSLTGLMDHPVLSEGQGDTRAWLSLLKDVAIDTNANWAKKLDIPVSTAITCVKPSGTVSQLVDSASGLHARYSKWYIRRIRNDAKDPLSTFLIEQGVSYEVDITSPSTLVFSFPIKSPDSAVLRNDRTALEQMEYWKLVQEAWCEHKPSITVYYKDDEFLALGQWVWDNFDSISGVAFLPHSDHTYKQAPYEEISEETYEHLQSKAKSISWDTFKEHTDNTTATGTLACTAGGCDIL